MKHLYFSFILIYFPIALMAQDLDKMSLPTLDSLRKLSYAQGDYDTAERYAKKIMAHTLQIQGKPDSAYALSIHNLANIYLNSGKYEEAEALYLESKEIRRKVLGTQHINYGASLSNLAALYKLMGRYEEAEPLHLEVKKLWEKLLGKAHPYYAANLNNMAILYSALKRYKEAEIQQLESLEIQAATLGKQDPNYISGLLNLASIYRDMKRYPEAESLSIEVKNALAATVGTEHPVYADNLNNLAGLYSITGQHEKTTPLRLEVVKIFSKLGKQHPRYLMSLNSLAQGYGASKQTQKAWDTVFEAIAANAGKDSIPPIVNEEWVETLKKCEYSSYQELLYSLHILQSLTAGYFNPTKEEFLEQKCIVQLALFVLNQVNNSYINESDKLRLLAESNKWSVYAMQTSLGLLKYEDNPIYKNDAFIFSELSKAALLSSSIQTERAYIFGDLPDSLIKKEQALQKYSSDLKAALLLPQSDSSKQITYSKLSSLNEEINAFKKQIETQYPKYSELKYAQITASISDIQKSLPKETALIEYLVSDSVIYIFYLDNNKSEIYSRPLRKDSLSLRIQNLRMALSDYHFIQKEPQKSYQLYTTTAYWFYQEFLLPVLKNKTNKQLVIIPDGELGYLPFETFLTAAAPADGNYNELAYLVKDYAISYNYSATLWKQNNSSTPKKNNGKILAAAASYTPSDNTNNAKKSFSRTPYLNTLRNNLSSLPSVVSEVQNLEQQFAGTFWYGKDANETAFKTVASEYQILHLAMHGLLNKKNPILSSLAFTENEDSLQDNFLNAYEISQLRLNASLVVLSACETGYGKFEKGEGVMSLARSFMYAGVPSLVVSLWQVNDASTAMMMQVFYQYLADGMDKAEALKQAKIQYLSKAEGVAAHPAFWSPFILLGDSRAIAISTKNNWWYWGIGGIGLLVLGAGIVGFRKR